MSPGRTAFPWIYGVGGQITSLFGIGHCSQITNLRSFEIDYSACSGNLLEDEEFCFRSAFKAERIHYRALVSRSKTAWKCFYKLGAKCGSEFYGHTDETRCDACRKRKGK
jgi:hypothetical protein